MGWSVDHFCRGFKDEAQRVICPTYMKKRVMFAPHTLLYSIRDLMKIYRTGDYDIVYAYGTKSQLITLLSVHEQERLVFDLEPVSIARRHLRKTAWKLIEKQIYTGARLFIVAAAFIKDWAIQLGVPREKIFVVPCGVDLTKFRPLHKPDRSSIKRHLGLSSKFVIVMTAPMASKGGGVAEIAAVRFVKKTIPRLLELEKDCVIMILGHREDAKIPGILWMGWVPDLSLYLNAADIAIAPYPHVGTFGMMNKVLEYMACGLPVVATEDGIRGIEGAKDLVHFIYCDSEVEDIITKIQLIKSDPKLRDQIGYNARKLLTEEFTWDRQLRKLNHILMTSLSSKV